MNLQQMILDGHKSEYTDFVPLYIKRNCSVLFPDVNVLFSGFVFLVFILFVFLLFFFCWFFWGGEGGLEVRDEAI